MVKIRKLWDLVPDDTDVLITNEPPYGTLDKPHKTVSKADSSNGADSNSTSDAEPDKGTKTTKGQNTDKKISDAPTKDTSSKKPE